MLYCIVLFLVYIYMCVKEDGLRLRLRFLWGEFWGETQGGPGLQIDNDNDKYTKTKTKYRVK